MTVSRSSSPGREHESEADTHRVGEPAVGNERPLLLHTHHLPHVLEAGVIRHLVVERGLVLLHDAYATRRQT